MVHMTRNALLVAGAEIGAEGDHWPVINSTIHDVMKDYVELQTERAVHTELKKHIAVELAEIDRIFPTLTPQQQSETKPYIQELRDVFAAVFSPMDEDALVESLEDVEVPAHIKRAEYLIQSLGEENE